MQLDEHKQSAGDANPDWALAHTPTGPGLLGCTVRREQLASVRAWNLSVPLAVAAPSY